MILVLDHRDSFTFNLVQALQALGASVEVARAAETSAAQLLAREPGALLLGPGPGTPSSARTALELLAARPEFPILGVCLGHQVLGLSEGARVRRARRLAHGRAVEVTHTGTGLFTGLPTPLSLTSYHSLVLDPETLPACLEVTAHNRDREPMGIRHRELPYEGIQLHPESILSEHGRHLLAAFLERA